MKLKMTQLLVLSALLVGNLSVGFASQKLRTQKHNTKPQTQPQPIKEEQPQVPLTVWQRTETALDEALSAAKQQAKTEEEEAKSSKETWCSPSVIVQVVLAIVGAGYLLFAYLQWISAKENLIANRRAFLSADMLVPYWQFSTIPGQINWTFRATLRNSGATPTKNLTMYIRCEVRDSVLPPKYAFEYDSADVAAAFIPANGGIQSGVAPRIEKPITPQDLAGAKDGKKFIYLWGWMRYFDTFPKTPEHITHYCWLLTVVGDPFNCEPITPTTPANARVLQFNYLQHGEGNYAN
jgi:hypothetical protein